MVFLCLSQRVLCLRQFFLGLSGTLTTSSSLSTTPLGCKWRRKCIRCVSILLQCVCVCVCFWLVGCHFSCIGVRLRNIEASRHSARNWKSISLKVRRGNERAENKWKKEVRQRMKRRQGGGNTGDQKIIVWGGGVWRKAGNGEWRRYYFKRWSVRQWRRWRRWGEDKATVSLPP